MRDGLFVFWWRCCYLSDKCDRPVWLWWRDIEAMEAHWRNVHRSSNGGGGT